MEGLGLVKFGVGVTYWAWKILNLCSNYPFAPKFEYDLVGIHPKVWDKFYQNQSLFDLGFEFYNQNQGTRVFTLHSSLSIIPT